MNWSFHLPYRISETCSDKLIRIVFENNFNYVIKIFIHFLYIFYWFIYFSYTFLIDFIHLLLKVYNIRGHISLFSLYFLIIHLRSVSTIGLHSGCRAITWKRNEKRTTRIPFMISKVLREKMCDSFLDLILDTEQYIFAMNKYSFDPIIYKLSIYFLPIWEHF